MSVADKIDIHALANLPGVGCAAEALVTAGLRLPPDVPEDYRLFRVEVEVTVTRSAAVSLIVAAEDRTAAMVTASEYDAVAQVTSWRDETTETTCRRIRVVTEQQALQMIRAERLPLEIDE